MPACYAYTRVSHADSAESGLSVEAQTEQVLRYREMCLPNVSWGGIGFRCRGREETWTDDGFFVDLAISAFKHDILRRPAGNRLHQILEAGDHLVFARLDRGFRSIRDFAEMLRVWEQRKIHVHFVEPNLDLSSPYGRTMAHIISSFAELQSAIASDRVKSALTEAKRSGRKTGGSRPLGSKIVERDGVLRLHPWDEELLLIGEIKACVRERRGALREWRISTTTISEAIGKWLRTPEGRGSLPGYGEPDFRKIKRRLAYPGLDDPVVEARDIRWVEFLPRKKKPKKKPRWPKGKPPSWWAHANHAYRRKVLKAVQRGEAVYWRDVV